MLDNITKNINKNKDKILKKLDDDEINSNYLVPSIEKKFKYTETYFVEGETENINNDTIKKHLAYLLRTIIFLNTSCKIYKKTLRTLRISEVILIMLKLTIAATTVTLSILSSLTSLFRLFMTTDQMLIYFGSLSIFIAISTSVTVLIDGINKYVKFDKKKSQYHKIIDKMLDMSNCIHHIYDKFFIIKRKGKKVSIKFNNIGNIDISKNHILNDINNMERILFSKTIINFSKLDKIQKDVANEKINHHDYKILLLYYQFGIKNDLKDYEFKIQENK